MSSLTLSTKRRKRCRNDRGTVIADDGKAVAHTLILFKIRIMHCRWIDGQLDESTFWYRAMAEVGVVRFI